MKTRTQNNFLSTLLVLVIIAMSLSLIPISANAQTPELDIRITTNKLPGLLAFLKSVAGKPHSSGRLRVLFEQSAAADTLDSEALERFKKLKLSVHCYRYRNLPHSKPICPWDFYRMAAVKATGWNDFRGRTAGLYSNDVQATIFQALHDLEPIYNALVWQPYRARFQRQVDSLKTYLKQHEVGALLQKMARFYGSIRPANLPVWVGFYPLPGEHGFIAHVSGNVVVSGMPVRLDDYAIYLSVIFHELGHRLFAQQPAALAHRIRKTMLASASSHRLFAYRWLDETLASAVGNGWVYHQLTGYLPKGGWYNNRYINRYAHAIYSRVAAYLNHGRQIDKDLLRYAVKQFETTFPNALTDPANVLTYFWLLMDAPHTKLAAFRRAFYKVFQPRMVMGSNLSNKYLDKALGTSLTTVIILTGSSSKVQQLIRQQLPALSQLPEKPYVYTIINGSHPVLLLWAKTPQQLQKILEKIRREGLMVYHNKTTK